MILKTRSLRLPSVVVLLLQSLDCILPRSGQRLALAQGSACADPTQIYASRMVGNHSAMNLECRDLSACADCKNSAAVFAAAAPSDLVQSQCAGGSCKSMDSLQKSERAS